MTIIIEETPISYAKCGRDFGESEGTISVVILDISDSYERAFLSPPTADPSIHGDYERYKGRVWITKQDATLVVQGENIAVYDEQSGHLSVLGFVTRKNSKWTHSHDKYFSLETIVWSVLTSFGWHEEHCRWLLK